jgi:hypothetical protein
MFSSVSEAERQPVLAPEVHSDARVVPSGHAVIAYGLPRSRPPPSDHEDAPDDGIVLTAEEIAQGARELDELLMCSSDDGVASEEGDITITSMDEYGQSQEFTAQLNHIFKSDGAFKTIDNSHKDYLSTNRFEPSEVLTEERVFRSLYGEDITSALVAKPVPITPPRSTIMSDGIRDAAFEACVSNNLHLLKKFMKDDRFNVATHLGTCVAKAHVAKSERVVIYLLETVETTHQTFATKLKYATKYGLIEVVEELLKYDVSDNEPLTTAADTSNISSADVKMIGQLVEKFATQVSTTIADKISSLGGPLAATQPGDSISAATQTGGDGDRVDTCGADSKNELDDFTRVAQAAQRLQDNNGTDTKQRIILDAAARADATEMGEDDDLAKFWWGELNKDDSAPAQPLASDLAIPPETSSPESDLSEFWAAEMGVQRLRRETSHAAGVLKKQYGQSKARKDRKKNQRAVQMYNETHYVSSDPFITNRSQGKFRHKYRKHEPVGLTQSYPTGRPTVDAEIPGEHNPQYFQNTPKFDPSGGTDHGAPPLLTPPIVSGPHAFDMTADEQAVISTNEYLKGVLQDTGPTESVFITPHGQSLLDLKTQVNQRERDKMRGLYSLLPNANDSKDTIDNVDMDGDDPMDDDDICDAITEAAKLTVARGRGENATPGLPMSERPATWRGLPATIRGDIQDIPIHHAHTTVRDDLGQDIHGRGVRWTVCHAARSSTGTSDVFCNDNKMSDDQLLDLAIQHLDDFDTKSTPDRDDETPDSNDSDETPDSPDSNDSDDDRDDSPDSDGHDQDTVIAAPDFTHSGVCESETSTDEAVINTGTVPPPSTVRRILDYVL